MKDFPQMFRERLFDEACSRERLSEAFTKVYKNRGAAGVDGVSVAKFKDNLKEELDQLSMELESWSYKPAPVKRVRIPKPNGGERLLGIPVVRDRVVQASLLSVLEPVFDSDFSESSFGFRPGRNQRQAVEAAQEYVKSGKTWVVDIDLSKFFDRIHHDRLIARLGKKVDDKRILRLVGMFLRSGVMENGLVNQTNEGSPQGGPLSPFLSNVVLDELDKELESKGLKFCRFADDCNIFVGSERAAERVMRSTCKFIEKKLKLVVNEEKSRTAPCDEVKFLGMTIVDASRMISAQSMQRAAKRVVELTPRGSHIPMEYSVKRINQWYVGWSNYYRMSEFPSQLGRIEARIRRRLRSRIVGEQKRRRNLVNKLIKRGVSKRLAARTVYSNKGRWALSHTRALERAYPNVWFKHTLGLKTMSDRNDLEADWKPLNIWKRLP